MLYRLSYRLTLRMLKKAPRFVLASLSTSTYRKKYASVPRSLRPRRKTFLNILQLESLTVLRSSQIMTNSPAHPSIPARRMTIDYFRERVGRRREQSKGLRSMIVSARFDPVEIMSIRHCANSSTRARYRFASAGSFP
jgi:hypothetical protein